MRRSDSGNFFVFLQSKNHVLKSTTLTLPMHKVYRAVQFDALRPRFAKNKKRTLNTLHLRTSEGNARVLMLDVGARLRLYLPAA